MYGIFLHGARGQCDNNTIVDCAIGANRVAAVVLAGGYGQFTYHFNYWGPTGCNRDTHRHAVQYPCPDPGAAG